MGRGLVAIIGRLDRSLEVVMHQRQVLNSLKGEFSLFEMTVQINTTVRPSRTSAPASHIIT